MSTSFDKDPKVVVSDGIRMGYTARRKDTGEWLKAELRPDGLEPVHTGVVLASKEELLAFVKDGTDDPLNEDQVEILEVVILTPSPKH